MTTPCAGSWLVRAGQRPDGIARTPKDEVTGRLVVRRIPDLNETSVDAHGALFPVWRYHSAFTDSPFVLVHAEAHHRGHAVIEQVFAEFIDGRWPTCLRPVRRPQRLARPDGDLTTSPAPPPRWPSPATRWPEPRPCAATWSTSPAVPAASPSTCPSIGRGSTPSCA
jgi:hypothetical protein